MKGRFLTTYVTAGNFENFYHFLPQENEAILMTIHQGGSYNEREFIYPSETNISPENWWLENEVSFSKGSLSGDMLIFRQGI